MRLSDSNNMKIPTVVGIGELLWDIFPDEKKIGGAPVNFAYHAAALGADSYAISAIGNDQLGIEILNLIDDTDINNYIEKVSQSTGTVSVDLIDGIPSYSITENVAWDYIPFNKKLKELAGRTDAVCFGTLGQRSVMSRETIRTFLMQVPSHTFKVLDINLRAPFYTYELISESIKLCNVLKMNDDELLILKEMFSIKNKNDKDACRWFVDTFKLNYLILTAGSKYSMIFSPANFSFMKTPKVEVVDTVGAGDSFTSAFVVSILKGKKLKDAHSDAIDRAAAVCGVAGAW